MIIISILALLVSSDTSSPAHLMPVEEVAGSDQETAEIPDASSVTNKPPKEELSETLGSSSTVDYSSHVSLSSQLAPPLHPPAWNKGMKVLLGCKVSCVHHVVANGISLPTANPGAAIQQDNTTENEGKTRKTSIIC